MYSVKTLILSTSHLSDGTCELASCGAISLATYDTGFFVYADPWAVQNPEEFNYPNDLIICMKYAIDHGCTYIKFDNYESVDPDLTKLQQEESA